MNAEIGAKESPEVRVSGPRVRHLLVALVALALAAGALLLGVGVGMVLMWFKSELLDML